MLLNWAIEEEQRMSDTYLIRPRINEKIWLLELNEEDKILTVYTALNVQLNEKEQGELKNLLLENNLNSLTINFSSSSGGKEGWLPNDVLSFFSAVNMCFGKLGILSFENYLFILAKKSFTV